MASVKPMPGLLLDLEFVDGRQARFGMAPYVGSPVFVRLKDFDYFSKAIVSHGTVEWPGGIDFDPDTLKLDSYSL